MEQSIINEFVKSRNQFADFMRNNFDKFPPNELENARKYYSYLEKVFKYQQYLLDLNNAAGNQQNKQQQTMTNIFHTYNGDRAFNQEKASEWLQNAVNKFTQGYSFDLVFFRKGNVKILKRSI